jgi:WD40 repeat protein
VETYNGQDIGKEENPDDINKDEDDEEDDILSHLNYRKLEKISEDFRKSTKKGLNMLEYLRVMLKHLPDIKDKVGLVKNLIELFKQIDVNGDATLEWDEFSNHIIELGMVRKDKTFIDAIKNYYSSEIIDDEKHDTEVEHVYFIEKLKHLLVMERDSKRFKVYDCKTGKFKQNVPDKSGASGGAVIGADYVESENLVATTSNNNSINLWDSNNYIFRERIPTSEIQLTVKWCESMQRLFTGGCDSVIHAFDVVDLKEIGVREGWNPMKKDKVGHEGPILDLLPIPDQGILVSCGIDAQICLWNLKNLEGKHTLVGHQLGVYSLDWYADTNILLSAGLDHDIYIWNPYVDKRIFLLKGHNHSLVGVKHLKGTHQIISADISGMFRIWDVRTFTTIQTFNCPLNEINCYALTWPPKRIVAGGRRLVFYDYDEPTDHHLADDQHCLCVLYNSVFYTFITAHPKCIKVWDACTGKLQSVFRELSSKDITCICLDERKRKLFFGNCKGVVKSINIKNGAHMKTFEEHPQDISCLHYWGEKTMLLSASWDSEVWLSDDSTSEEEAPTRARFERHKLAVNFVDFKPSHSLCASCSDDKSVIIYNYGSNRQEGLLAGHELEVKI